MRGGTEGPIPERVGEVVESASHQFSAQCYRLYESPPLGSFVRTEAPLPSDGSQGSEEGPSGIYAVVCRVSTQSIDPGRPVIARGEVEETEEDIYRSSPQLARLLCTRFDAVIVGHGRDSRYRQYLPAVPPRIHAFVYQCTSKEVESFSASLDFLTTLANMPMGSATTNDEVVASCLRRASAQVDDSREFLLRAGKALAQYMAGDMPRLTSILKKISP